NSPHSLLYFHSCFPGHVDRRRSLIPAVLFSQIPLETRFARQKEPATGGGRLRALIVRVQLGRGGGDGSHALGQAYNAALQEWFRKEIVKHGKGRTALEPGLPTKCSAGIPEPSQNHRRS